MELHQAIRHIVQTEGADILNELRLINILTDLNAFENVQGSKYIMRAIIADGFCSQFSAIGGMNANANNLIARFISTTGFDSDAATKIFQSIAFGLGWLNAMPNPKPSTPNNPSKPSPAPAPAPKSQATHLNLTYSQLENKSDSFKHRYAQDAEQYLDSVIQIIGNPPKDLGVTGFNANCSFSGEYNNFDINLEIEGGIKTSFQYSIVFTLVVKSIRGKVLAKEEIYVDKSSAKNPYFVETVSILEDEFRKVCDISEIKIYWKKS